MQLTSSILYNYMQCPHRVWRDLYGPLEERSPEENPFVELLWQKGVLHEEKVVASLGEYSDLKDGPINERRDKTREHMKAGTPLIYQGVIEHGDLLGIPDLLRVDEDGFYIPIDIKSGLGLEGIDDDISGGKLKSHYAVQLCLYSEILRKSGFASGNRGIILDIRGNEVLYELDLPRGARTPGSWTELYESIKEEVRLLLNNSASNTPALSGVCKLCRWHQSCRKWCESGGDLSMIFCLGRSRRDALSSRLGIKKAGDLSGLDIEAVMERKKQDKSFLGGIGEKTLRRFALRAEILSKKKPPEIYEKIEFPAVETEFFFDIEDDPTRDFIYLHGLYRREASGENFVYFFAVEHGPAHEEKAWAEFWDFMDKYDMSKTAVYFYSAHEKTVYRKLREKYPDVVTEEKLEGFFEHPNVIDLYGIVYKNTDWPLSSYSVKDIAGYLGFDWRDKTPSGVLSIQWFNEYLDTQDPGIFQRIIEYNEDDCRATMVLKDGLKKLSEERFG